MSTVTMPSVLRRDATVISLVGFAHGTSHFFHLMLPPLFPWLIKEYSVSYTQVGALMSVFFVVSGGGQALAGFLVDRWGAHRVLCAGVGLLACSGILVAAAPGFSWLFLAALVAGLGNCVFHPADFSLLNHRVTQARLGHAFSVHGLSGNLGWALSPLAMTAAASAFGWRAAGLVAASAGGVSLATLVWKRAELTDGGPLHETPYKRTMAVRDLLALRLTWVSFSFFFFYSLGFGALQNFAPSLLQDLYGLSLAVATSALTAFLVGGAAGLAAGGFVAGTVKGQERLVGLAFLGSAGIALLFSSLIVPSWAVIGAMTLMGFGIGLAGPSRDMLVRKSTVSRLGTGAFGRIYGLVYSGADVGLAVSPPIFGMLMDARKTHFVFAGVAISLVLAIVAAQAIAHEAR
jgi:MFS family permease